MNKLYFSIIILFSQICLHAQVTVGEGVAPNSFSVLEVSTVNTQGGLRLPRLTTAQRDSISQTPDFISEMNRGNGVNPVGKALGLAFYNTDTNCIEYWDGYRWVSRCFDNNPANISEGVGTFTGKTLFDIVYSNDNVNGCTFLITRVGQQSVFSNRTEQDPAIATVTAPYSGVQVYTFTPVGTVSKVRFEYVDVTGQVIESILPAQNYSTMTGITDPCKVKVSYNTTLDTELRGRNNRTALKADLYVIYNDNSYGTGVDKRLKLPVTLQDCTNCGAKTVTGGWLNFMCQNLGADPAIDPFTYVMGNAAGGNGTLGWLYQWGRQSDDHQSRNSNTTSILATSNTPGNANFILAPGSPNDWRSGSGETSRWGNGTADVNPPKATNDPCPAGWKVPSQKQWEAIFGSANTNTAPGSATANTWAWISNGFKVGDALFLPGGGNRFYSTGAIVNLEYGAYWSSTVSGGASIALFFASSSVNRNSNSVRSGGLSVRCIEDY